jgi:hypothetical protein
MNVYGLEHRYLHLSKSKRDTPARRANRAMAVKYIEEIQAEQVEKDASRVPPSGSSLRIADRYAAGPMARRRQGV